MNLRDELIARASLFGTKIANLLNRTVADGVTMCALFDPRRNECRVAQGISRKTIRPVPIPLRVGKRAPSGHLFVHHRLCFDRDGEYLTDTSSTYIVLRDPEARPLFRYEYERGKQAHPEAHLHVEATFTHGLPQHVKPLPKLHLPVGGRRFRPTLEDVVEFLICEGFATGRDGWEEAVEEHRQDWNVIQLKAAVRNDPESALEVLRKLGVVDDVPIA